MLKQFKFMKKTLHHAHKALELNEWPVGAVVIANNKNHCISTKYG